MFCQHCGSPMDDAARFCPACGSVQGESIAPSLAPAFTPPLVIKARSWHWIGQGWELVKSDLTAYLVMSLLFVVLNAVLPIVLQGALSAGMQIAALKKIHGRRIEFADMFKGFNFFVPTLVAHLLTAVFVSAGLLLCIVPGLVVGAMYLFPSMFIVDRKMEFWPAMQASHALVKNDYFGFTMFLLCIILVNLIGVLCCVVGVLVTLPLTYAAIAVAYHELVGSDPNSLPA
jgi:uncharacterized membrane protein